MEAQAQAVAESASAQRIAEGVAAVGSENGGDIETTEEDIVINILDRDSADGDVDIKLTSEVIDSGYGDLEISYAEKLDGIALKTNKIFSEIIDDLFNDDQLLPRLRRLFWLEATKSERDFNNLLVKPLLKQHDRNLADEELRQAMEVDLESVSDVEELMRVWEGLHKLEERLAI
jgi:hypothetical protein